MGARDLGARSVVRTFNTGTVSVATSKTTIVSLALSVGTWYFDFGGTLTLAANSFTTQLDFTGTATVGYEGWLVSAVATPLIVPSYPLTAFGTTMGSAVASTHKIQYTGIIVVTVAGSLNWAGTAVTSAKTVNQGSRGSAERWA